MRAASTRVGFTYGMLISTAELRTHLHEANWLIFDCRHDMFNHARGSQVFAEGHIPGAYFAAVETDLSGHKTGLNGRHPLPEVEAWIGFLNRHGVSPDTQIVAYDDAGGQYAARLWWLARWVGLTKVAVLDGGYGKWKAEQQPVTTESAVVTRPGTLADRADHLQVRTTEDILRDLPAGKMLLVDARAPERYRGETEPIDCVAGHIPGGLNRFFKLNLNPDLTMRPASELRQEFEALLASQLPGQVVHQCGSGVTACVNLLAMEYAGLTGSALYVGSWSEWIAQPERPIGRGA